MNILVTSAGRRVKIIQCLKKAFENTNGNIIAADCDKNAPALYFADSFELVPRIDNNEYLNSILSLCKKHNITAIISLIDPELRVLAMNKNAFDRINVELILSPLNLIQYTFDKQKTYNYLSDLGIPTVPTYNRISNVETLLSRKHMTFPLVVKPGKGSASNGIEVVENIKELKHAFSTDENLIIQPFYKDFEYGIDVYIDMIDGHLVDMLRKEKSTMRSGETDKSVSVHIKEVEELVSDLISKTNFRGPIDIYCFLFQGKYYISEINPRFGGGYPHAYEMGSDFMEYIVNNLKGNVNSKFNGYRYETGYVMMKYDNVILINDEV